MSELKEIALELLTKYSYAQINCIWEKSFDIKDDEKALDNEIQEYLNRIAKACNEETDQNWSVSEYDERCYEEKIIDLTLGEIDYEINE